MGLINKENIRNAVKNPFLFVIIALLIIIALGQSFALWCLIGSLVGVVTTLINNNSSIINNFCDGGSWKVKSMNSFSTILGDNIILIIVLSLIAWILLNFTERGKKLISFLD